MREYCVDYIVAHSNVLGLEIRQVGSSDGVAKLHHAGSQLCHCVLDLLYGLGNPLGFDVGFKFLVHLQKQLADASTSLNLVSIQHLLLAAVITQHLQDVLLEPLQLVLGLLFQRVGRRAAAVDDGADGREIMAAELVAHSQDALDQLGLVVHGVQLVGHG